MDRRWATVCCRQFLAAVARRANPMGYNRLSTSHGHLVYQYAGTACHEHLDAFATLVFPPSLAHQRKFHLDMVRDDIDTFERHVHHDGKDRISGHAPAGFSGDFLGIPQTAPLDVDCFTSSTYRNVDGIVTKVSTQNA